LLIGTQIGLHKTSALFTYTIKILAFHRKSRISFETAVISKKRHCYINIKKLFRDTQLNHGLFLGTKQKLHKALIKRDNKISSRIMYLKSTQNKREEFLKNIFRII
jgi:hypothetical protein